MKTTQQGNPKFGFLRSKLRSNMTTPEQIMWLHLRFRQFHSLKFRRQHGIGDFIVDFYCPEKRVVIEIDGETHADANQTSLDRHRDAYFQSLGVKTIRYYNQDITSNVQGVLEDLQRQLFSTLSDSPLQRGRTATPSDSPLQRGRKLKALRDKIRSLGSAVVAFSGGVDSAVLVKIAFDELHSKMLAVTGDSPTVPSIDREGAQSFCKVHGIPHRLVPTFELRDPNYVKNPDDRCYYCKKELFVRLREVAKGKGYNFIIEGTNASDIGGHRPGFKAVREAKNVVVPYVELGITKEEIRAIANKLGLDLADKPSSACLASRIPTNTMVEEELLRRVDEAESFLRSLGITQVRLRHHGEVAMVEVDPSEFQICYERRGEIVDRIKKLGYKFVVLDLEGYRTGGARG